MLNIILTTIWIFLPSVIANMGAGGSKHFPKIKAIEFPIDLGKTYKGKRILGDGKTFRGFLFGVTIAIIFTYVQIGLSDSEFIKNILTVEYNNFNPLIWGFLLGLGALAGDATESFFKRRVGIERGEPWFPFDQTDFVIGATLLSLIYIRLDIKYYIVYLITYFLIHLTGKYFLYKVGIENKKI